MRHLTISLLAITLFAVSTFAQTTVTKTASISLFGGQYKTADDAKAVLLNMAKKSAVEELFGEFIRSISKVENFSLTSVDIEASSMGFIRVKGDPVYYQGENLGEICVKIEAYVTPEDLDKFKPKQIVKKVVVADPNLTLKQVEEEAKKKAKISALVEYDERLKGLKDEFLLPLVHEVNYSDAHFIEGTTAFSINMTGMIYPIEILTIIPNIEKQLAKQRVENLSGKFDFLGKIGNHEYWLSRDVKTWTEAKKACEQYGGHLITISSKDEDNLAVQGAKMRNKEVWIGLNDAETEGVFRWITNEPLIYTNWANSQPDNWQNNEDYCHIMSSYYNYKWNDEKSTNDFYFILEIE
jgi:hypothetical protein